MNAMKKLRVFALAFAYGLIAVAPVMADDSELYVGGVAGGGGTAGTLNPPNVLLLLDTSGSMLFTMYDKYPAGHPNAGATVPTQAGNLCSTNLSSSYDCGKNEDDRRSRHLLNAVKRIVENMDGNIRVGIGRYNNGGSPIGGRIIYPVRGLAEKANPSATSENRTYSLSASASDAHQAGSLGSNIDLTAGELLLGDTPVTTVSAGVSNDQVQAGTTSTVLTNNPGIIPLGGYFYYTNSGKTASTKSASSVGLKYNVSIPKNATIVSAELVMTRSTSNITGPSSTQCGYGCYPNKDSSGAFSVSLDFQSNTVTPADYANTTAARVNGSNRTYGGGVYSTTVNVGATELTASNTTKTVDVTSQVQALVNGGSWSTSANLALRLHGTNDNLASPVGLPLIGGLIVTSGRAISEPQLKITWNESSDRMYTGVQFSSVTIPRGATINSATLDFTPSQTSSGTAQWEIITDSAVIPAPFSSANDQHLDAARWVGDTPVSWTPPAWTKDTKNANTKVNVTALLQRHVNKSDFCGGLGVAFRIRQTGLYSPANTNTRRYAYSYDGDASKAPQLVVNYTLPAEGDDTCLLAGRTVTVRGGTDDGENVSGTQQLTATTARLRSNNEVGLRFANLNVPKGALVREVKLTLKAANTPSSGNRGNFTVRGVVQSDVDTLSATNTIKSLIDGGLTTSTATITPTAWTNGTKHEFADRHAGASKPTGNTLPAVIQAIVDQDDWVPGNGLALILKGSINSTAACGTAYPCFMQADSGSASAASLQIFYESEDVQDGIKTVRDDLLELMDTMTGNYYGGGTPMAASFNEAALYMMGGDVSSGKGSSFSESKPAQNAGYTKYISPITGGACQANNIIMLTDGDPSSDRNISTGGTCNGSWDCMKKTATHLHNTGFSHVEGGTTLKSTVGTYTIGFGPEVVGENATAAANLSAVATAGGGVFFPATDVESLVSSFETIIARLTDTNGTMASPGVAVNQLNRTQHLDQLYYGVFKPQVTKRWPGNLKRYRLNPSANKGKDASNNDIIEPAVVDVDGALAIADNTKYFSKNAKSWWSDDVDGNEAHLGGSASKQTAKLKVYTDNPATNALSELDSATPPGTMSANDVKWIQGYDVDDQNGQGANGFRQSMGAPMHAQPTMLAKPNGTDYTVFIGTNDGLLQAIDNSNGNPLWAWLPSDLWSNVAALRANGALMGESPIYGLDGTWTLVNVPGEPDKRLLVGGMRQGGSNYYALEIDRDPTVKPKLVWAIRPSTSGFGRLGYTWSQPQAMQVRIGGVSTPVLVFGGGFDYNKYEAGQATLAGTGATPDKGNAVYMVNATTGALIWSTSNTGASSDSYTKTTAIKYSIPGSIRAVDKNGDGLVDHLYFADLGGQIFRVDMDNKSSAPQLVKRVALLAQLGNAAEGNTPTKLNDRRFYETPAVEYAIDDTKKLYAAVAIGSGDRTFPKQNRTTKEIFVVLRDYDGARFDILENQDNSKPTAGYMDEAGKGYNGTADLATYSAPFKEADFANLSTTFGATATAAANAKKGWLLKMPIDYEKVLSSPFIYSQRVNGVQEYRVSFNSFAPDKIAATCAPIKGSTNSWDVLLRNAAPSKSPNSTDAKDRVTEGIAAGITGSGVPMILDGKLVNLEGVSGDELGDAPPVGSMQRTRWFDRRTN